MSRKVRLTILSVALFLSLGSSQYVYAQESNEQTDVETFFNNFLNTWLIDQDIDRALSMIDRGQEFKRSVTNMFEVSDIDLDVWIRKVLVEHLEEDHGLMSEMGHGDPRVLGYNNLPTQVSELRSRQRWENLDQVIEGNRDVEKVQNNDFVGHILPSKAQHVVYFIMIAFNRVSHEGLNFLVSRVGDQWKVVYIFWLVG